ncbi:ATP-binding protein [Eupransor demetentiae]|uniref:DNA replication protein DnaC (DnaC) n=1 Tax=Eupransor demetentiae TaxID=3109584 RepID=A0ABM9N4P8_9LACO|nr:DNA replication protein DnaC (DnaC) [Lactobacillaceae bacterium LMG 33000]
MQSFADAAKPLTELKGYKEAEDSMSHLTAEQKVQWFRQHIAEKDQASYNQIMAARRRRYTDFSLWGTSSERTFSFDQWQPSWQPNTAKAEELKNKARHLAYDCIKQHGRNIAAFGSAGTGKTAMVLAMLNAIKEHSHKTVMFVSTVPLSEMVHQFKDEQVQDTVRKTKDLMKSVDVLVLDDFGSEAGGMSGKGVASDSLQRFYFDVAEARQARDKNGKRLLTTIVTTNFNGQELYEKYNAKLISRLIAKRPENQLNFDGLEDVRD